MCFACAINTIYFSAFIDSIINFYSRFAMINIVIQVMVDLSLNDLNFFAICLFCLFFVR